jgi:hypothetical protein
MMRDIIAVSASRGWFSADETRFALRELLLAAHRETGRYEILS